MNEPFAAYDAFLENSITEHWYKLSEETPVPLANPILGGKVILEFRLLPQGDIKGLKIVHTTSSEEGVQICQDAIVQSAPFPPWPIAMRNALTTAFVRCDLRFTSIPR